MSEDILVSDLLKSIEGELQSAVHVGWGIERVLELQARVKNARRHAEYQEQMAGMVDAETTKKMKTAVLALTNRAVIDYEFGQIVGPYSEPWELLMKAAAAVLNKNETIYRRNMKELWYGCPRPEGAAPRLTAAAWMGQGAAKVAEVRP